MATNAINIEDAINILSERMHESPHHDQRIGSEEHTRTGASINDQCDFAVGCCCRIHHRNVRTRPTRTDENININTTLNEGQLDLDLDAQNLQLHSATFTEIKTMDLIDQISALMHAQQQRVATYKQFDE
jgi:hypothetical protein